MTQPIPAGFRTVTPSLVISNAPRALAFYQEAFGAEVISQIYMPDGKTLMHAEIKIGDSRVMLGEEAKEWGALSPYTLEGSPVTLHLYVEDVDAAWARAVKAGCKIEMPLETMFWGDRYGKLTDPFGHHWSMATHVEDLSDAEIEKRAAEAFAKK
jgi:uncharacterized glyoxalase superfamily protein PhnB